MSLIDGKRRDKKTAKSAGTARWCRTHNYFEFGLVGLLVLFVIDTYVGLVEVLLEKCHSLQTVSHFFVGVGND